MTFSKSSVISLIGYKSCRSTDDTNIIKWAFVKKENGGSIATFGQLGLDLILKKEGGR